MYNNIKEHASEASPSYNTAFPLGADKRVQRGLDKRQGWSMPRTPPSPSQA